MPTTSAATPTATPGDRLARHVRDFMRPGVVTIPEHASLLDAKRALVAHSTHAVLVLGADAGRPLGWVTAGGLLGWLERDLAAIPAERAITEPPHFIAPDDSAADALRALAEPGVTHLLVGSIAGGPAHGVVAAIDVVDLVTRP
jgi:CBS domain-containing protein